MSAAVGETWSWAFDAPPAALWPILADTTRFNEAAGFPKHTVEEIARADGTVLRLARGRLGPLALEWEEQPFEWIEGRGFSETRLFRTGPIRRFTAALSLEPTGRGSRLEYTLSFEPASLLGAALVRLHALPTARRTIDRLVRSAATFVAGERPTPFPYKPPATSAAVRERVDGMVAELAQGPYGHGLARRLADHVLTAQEVDLMRMRPLQLASDWGAPARDVVELCLAAVRVGLLDMHWDLLCSRCRGAKAVSPSLDRLPTGAHCPSCAIDYERDFARNVELTFTPAARVRAVVAGEYCVGGPMVTRHIAVQRIVADGAERRMDVALLPGPYRLRTLERGAAAEIDHQGGPFPALVAGPEGVEAGALQPEGTLLMENRAGAERTFIIESRDWAADALTAHRATTLQSFRDLFAGEAPRAGDEMGIAQVTLLFTDLKGSTALYERIGDGTAFRWVREHFAVLADTVRRHDGAVVKTIGDAVMAAFAEPARGVEAALAIQREVAAFNGRLGLGADGLVIKLGLHAGPCIVVRLNDQLDYFGSAVNLAARLGGVSRGGDIVLSGALAIDPGVAALLAGVPTTEETATLKGFDHPVPVVRLGTGP